MSPSLSKSPKAQPRLMCGSATPGPASSINSSKRPLPRFAKHDARRLGRKRRQLRLQFRMHAACDQKQVGITVVVQIDDARPPTNKARFHAQGIVDLDNDGY